MNPTPKIEEYNGCHYFLFLSFNIGNHTSLVASTYNMEMMELILPFVIDSTFGVRNMTYTLVEK